VRTRAVDVAEQRGSQGRRPRQGRLAEATTGAKVWIDFSSIDKDTIVSVGEELSKKGWTVVDASAGGVEEVAAAGQLALWLSGSKALFDEHQPIFKAMGKSILHGGELGNAKLVKNAMAMLAAVQHLSFVEICCWLKKGGLDEATFQAIIKNSQQDSVASRRIMEILVSRKFKPRKSWMPKDVGFGLDMARNMEVPMPFVGLASQMFAIAQATDQDGYEATGIACNVYDVINGNKTKPA
jgi:3-hydroxyisobutyrate dehydrogenase-like beta-hydroxyacid dehydrogenase